MTNYCLGFLFSDDGESVALIRKNKPEWQKNLLNGIGGKIEGKELPLDAMRREFKEEAGVKVENWTYFGELTGPDWTVYLYKAFSSDLMLKTQSKTKEKVDIYLIDYLARTDTVGNLLWIIQMALDKDSSTRFKAKISYND